ncbi:MAG: hypothetical protein ABIK98_10115 [Pseudomonadota bacterium]|uniref:Uncharacterized protein n=1 Tax=Candidatus Desulfatibia profunda TaxID=2841695 RepID=A0A8J6NXK5_9BACT|nr:hypothetical protein [Candidatus Desulfatibia profunda]MBL7178664.1 hypothetical protein [Desulfobacterales bacterium]MBU0698469.1 hypothetical protein [Pseudomonadota bacterium]
MSDINLQEGKINFEGQWLSVENLTGRIKEKMDAGDMKFSSLAIALEELNKALENSHTIETKLVIHNADYEKLKALGGGDDLTCVRKAIMAFIEADVQEEPVSESTAEPEEKKKKTLKCAKCKATIEISVDEMPTEIVCPECGTIGRLKPHSKNEVRRQDHFLGKP